MRVIERKSRRPKQQQQRAQQSQQTQQQTSQRQKTPPPIKLPAQLQQQIFEIDRLIGCYIRPYEAQKCFCQARQHPISNPPTRCPHCALLICNLNGMLQCPSCNFQPLLSQPERELEANALQTHKYEIIEGERMSQEQDKIDAERLAKLNPYPALQNNNLSYAATAGHIEDKIEKAYKNQQQHQQQQQQQQKRGNVIMSINSTTNKITVQSSSNNSATPAQEPTRHDKSPALRAPTPFHDPYDDGITT